MTEQQQAAMRQALEALEYAAEKVFCQDNDDPIAFAITALRQALEQQPADEPACWDGDDKCPNRQACCDAEECLYTRPQPAAQWVGLTAQQQREGMAQPHRGSVGVQEAKLREKNGGAV